MKKAKRHKIRRMVRVCPACQGGGVVLTVGTEVTCRKCRGTGRLRQK
jgi:DnaJ-class molecular chaperone